MNVVYLKLVTGEEVVGEYVTETDETINIKNTLAVIIRPDQDGKFSFGLMPWGATDNAPKEILKNTMIYRANPNEQLYNVYVQQFGGIVRPSKTLLT